MTGMLNSCGFNVCNVAENNDSFFAVKEINDDGGNIVPGFAKEVAMEPSGESGLGWKWFWTSVRA